jgi:hypothetical protein
MSQQQNAEEIRTPKVNTFKTWQHSNTWKKDTQIKCTYMKKSRLD